MISARLSKEAHPSGSPADIAYSTSGLQRVARAIALLPSHIHNTELAASHTTHVTPLSPVVPQARWRIGAYTTNSCSTGEPPNGAHSRRFVNRSTNALRGDGAEPSYNS